VPNPECEICTFDVVLKTVSTYSRFGPFPSPGCSAICSPKATYKNESFLAQNVSYETALSYSLVDVDTTFSVPSSTCLCCARTSVAGCTNDPYRSCCGPGEYTICPPSRREKLVYKDGVQISPQPRTYISGCRNTNPGFGGFPNYFYYYSGDASLEIIPKCNG
jgi:hypothetical protein